MKTSSVFFSMADTFRKNFDDDVHDQVNARRNNRRKSKAKLKTFSYNNQTEDYWDIAEELDDDQDFEKFSKRR
jgi:hypothetical protein